MLCPSAIINSICHHALLSIKPGYREQTKMKSDTELLSNMNSRRVTLLHLANPACAQESACNIVLLFIVKCKVEMWSSSAIQGVFLMLSGYQCRIDRRSVRLRVVGSIWSA